jgi:hypothetical protein
MNDRHDLELLFRARHPIVAIETREERRALALLRELGVGLGRPLFKWTVTEGLLGTEFDFGISGEHTEPAEVLLHIKQLSRPGLYVLVDFHPYLNDPVHVRLLKDIALQHDQHDKTIVLLSHDLALPAELRNLATRYSLSLPGPDAVRDIVKQVASRWATDNHGRKVRADRKALDLLVNNLTGLTASEARRLATRAIYDDGAIDAGDLPRMMQAKYELLNRDGILYFEYDTTRFSEVAGFRTLRKWLEQRQSAFATSHDERAPHLDTPKGILLLGVQGCGKSLAAKAVAGVWGIPLLRFDVGALFNKYHGETERNLRDTLKAAEAMAPCVLWIDEIEKALAGQDQDSGTSRRVLGTLLTWMAEKDRPVFLVATANDITALPPELVRKGRLDEIFFVDLPDLATRKHILEIHLRRREQDPMHFNTGELARRSEGFAGAELEQCVVSALYNAQARQRPLDDAMLQAELETTRPLSVLMAEKIDDLRSWAAERTVSAD